MQRNLKLIPVFSFFWMFLVLIPVLVPFWTGLGLSMSQIFQLQAIFAIGVAAFEIPTGYLGDLFGRKLSMLAGSFLTGVGFTMLLFMKTFPGLVAYELVLAVGLSFVSGSDLALFYDSAKHLRADRSFSTKTVVSLQFWNVVGEAAGSLLGGFLVIKGFGLVLQAQAVAGWMPFVICLFLKEAPMEKTLNRHEHWKNFLIVWRHIFSGDEIVRLTFLNWLIWGLSTFFAVWIHQEYWSQAQLPLSIFGAYWAALNLIAGFMGRATHKLEARIGPGKLLWVLAILPILGYLGMAAFGAWLGVLFSITFYLSRGITQVLLRDAFNWRTPSEFRATANSVNSLLFRFGFAVFGPLIGWGIDHAGIRPTLFVLGISFAMLALWFLRPLVRKVRALAPHHIPST